MRMYLHTHTHTHTWKTRWHFPHNDGNDKFLAKSQRQKGVKKRERERDCVLGWTSHRGHARNTFGEQQASGIFIIFYL